MALAQLKEIAHLQRQALNLDSRFAPFRENTPRHPALMMNRTCSRKYPIFHYMAWLQMRGYVVICENEHQHFYVANQVVTFRLQPNSKQLQVAAILLSVANWLAYFASLADRDFLCLPYSFSNFV